MKKVILFMVLASAIVGCKKSEDSEAPVIQYIKVNDAISAEHELEAGVGFSVQFIVSDNEELNQIKISVHPADDGHSHGGAGEVVAPNIGVWSDSEIINLSGTSANQTVLFGVPADIAGYWHLEVLLIDRDGNESEEFITTLHVENADLPMITITTDPLVVDGEIAVVPGGNVTFSAAVTDADGLGMMHLHVEDEAGVEVDEFEADGASATSFTFGPETIGFPTEGHYHLHFTATDSNGLTNEYEVDVHVEL